MGRIHHRRFYVLPSACLEGRVEFDAAQTHQLLRVLRLAAGETVSVFDGSGREVLAVLQPLTGPRATARILRDLPAGPAPRLRITLAQVVPRGPAMDLIVAKATELGVSCIQPLEAAQSVSHGSRRGPRWSRIAQEAAEQCGRRELPTLCPTRALAEFLRAHPREAPLLACHPEAGARPLPNACESLAGAHAVALLVGGEGGLRPAEADLVVGQGGVLVSLGPLRLRVETAALAGIALLQACLGSWSAPEGAA